MGKEQWLIYPPYLLMHMVPNKVRVHVERGRALHQWREGGEEWRRLQTGAIRLHAETI
jgi:hypothetical protein